MSLHPPPSRHDGPPPARSWRGHAWLRYALAFTLVAAATLLTSGLHRVISAGGIRVTFAFFYLAVFLTARYGGRAPGLVAVILSAALGNYFFLPPYDLLSLGFSDIFQVAVFVLVAGLLVHLTERSRRAEAETQSGREWLGTTLRSIGDAVIATDEGGRVTFMNPVAQQLTGWAMEEARGRPLAEVFRIVNEGTREPVESPAAKVMRDGAVVGLANHTVLLARDGREIPIDDSGAPIKDQSGRLTGVVLVFHDITERRQVERERTQLSSWMEVERRRLRELVGNVPGVVWEAWGAPDESGQRIDFVSDHVEEMLGYTVDEWLSTPNFWLTIVHPEDRERAAREAHAIFESRRGGVSQFRWVAKDGRVIPVESQSNVILDERGNPVGMRGVTMDVAQHKQAEERLRESRARLSGIVNSAMDAIITVDDEQRILLFNHAAEKMFRCEAPEAVGQPLDRFIPERFRAAHREHIEEFGRGGVTTRAMAAARAVSGLRADGEEFLLEASISQVETGGQKLYTVIMRDITERVRAEKEREQLLARAQEVNRAKDEFLATLSHELRTPLTPIIGWTHMIRSGRLGASDSEQGLRVIEKNSQALSRLINDLLDMSSIMSGKMRIERAAVDLGAVVREAVETVRPKAEERGVALEVAARDGDAPVSVSGDRTRLVQVFWNLLSNAVKFSPGGGRVRVEFGVADGAARVEVADEGQGIAPEFLPHVFERFRQADASTTRAHGGLGIGLALVKSFVEAHGGTVAAASDGEGRGSRFTVTLPVLQTPAARGAGTGEFAFGGEEPCAEDACRVLLVEDAPDTLDMLRLVFESRGYSAVPCQTADEALRIAESSRFDIIVSDIGLPLVDGYELIRRLRRMPHLRAVPALALTGYAAPKDAEAALEAGFDAHIPKPVDPASLTEEVEQLLKQKPARDGDEP